MCVCVCVCVFISVYAYTCTCICIICKHVCVCMYGCMLCRQQKWNNIQATSQTHFSKNYVVSCVCIPHACIHMNVMSLKLIIPQLLLLVEENVLKKFGWCICYDGRDHCIMISLYKKHKHPQNVPLNSFIGNTMYIPACTCTCTCIYVHALHITITCACMYTYMYMYIGFEGQLIMNKLWTKINMLELQKLIILMIIIKLIPSWLLLLYVYIHVYPVQIPTCTYTCAHNYTSTCTCTCICVHMYMLCIYTCTCT